MRPEKHGEILEEVGETIQQALESPDILRHQRRLAAMLSLGAQQLMELHLHRQMVLKPGAAIKHEWFALGTQNLRLKLAAVITTDIDRVPGLSELMVLGQEVEKERNDMIYGSPLTDTRALREKIDAYLKMKTVVENDDGQKP